MCVCVYVCVCVCVCRDAILLFDYSVFTPSLLCSVLFLVVFTSDDPIMSVLQVEVTCQVVRPER